MCFFITGAGRSLIGNNGIAPWSEDLDKSNKLRNKPDLSKYPYILYFGSQFWRTYYTFCFGSLSSLLSRGWVPLAVQLFLYYLLVPDGSREPFLLSWDILLVESLLLSALRWFVHRLGSKSIFPIGPECCDATRQTHVRVRHCKNFFAGDGTIPGVNSPL